MNEHERIRALGALHEDLRDAAPGALRAILGIGDDAAIVEVPGAAARLVLTVDDQIEGTHFRTSWLSFEELGSRATMAAASDVAAMGGRVSFVLSSIAAPATLDDDALIAIARGQKEAAERLGARVIGGNLARSAVLALSTTVIGAVSGEGLRRDGARPGHVVWLAGHVGRAAAGLALLSGPDESWAHDESAVGRAASVCIGAWRSPLALQAAGLAALACGASAAVDVSDGLAADAGHLAAASGVHVVLEAPSLLLDATLRAFAAKLGRDPLDLALAGGEDYALLVTAKPEIEAIPGFVRVGRCEAGEVGVSVELAGGARVAPPVGWDHFR